MAMEPIKLSEVKDDQMLVVKAFSWQDGNVISKSEYIKSSEYIDRNKGEYEAGFPKVYIADEEIDSFSLSNSIEAMEDDKYEDWYQDVWNALVSELGQDKITEFEDAVNRVIEKYPTYWNGRKIDVEA